MKKCSIILLLIILQFIIPNKIYATDEIIKSTEEMLDISSFLTETKKYTNEIFNDIDLSDLLNSAVSGNIDNSSIINKILKLLGFELKSQISLLVSIIFIIVVHSVLKSISDGLENDEISKISYFVQYILIVSLIMNNFSDIIVSIKETIQSLVGFSYSLIPLLLTLMMITGKMITVSTIQPILLGLITFIGTFISNFILPLRSLV